MTMAASQSLPAEFVGLMSTTLLLLTVTLTTAKGWVLLVAISAVLDLA